MARHHTEYNKEKVLKYISDHYGNISKVAEELGCCRTTFYGYVKRNQDIQDAIDSERERVLDKVEGTLQDKAIAGEPWAVCFYLKTQGKKRGYVEKPEAESPLEALLQLLPKDVRKVVTNALQQAIHTQGDTASPEIITES